MFNQESSLQPLESQNVAISQEIDTSEEAISQLLPGKLLDVYPDARIDVISPTRPNKELTILISSASAELQTVSLAESLLAAYEHGLLYCRIEFLSLKGETANTIAYIPKHDDRPEIRHKGINAEFYANLYAYLKSQGIKYVFGINKLEQEGSHSHFFLEKLGRSTFDALPEEFVKKIPDRFLVFKSLLTVQFL